MCFINVEGRKMSQKILVVEDNQQLAKLIAKK